MAISPTLYSGCATAELLCRPNFHAHARLKSITRTLVVERFTLRRQPQNNTTEEFARGHRLLFVAPDPAEAFFAVASLGASRFDVIQVARHILDEPSWLIVTEKPESVHP